MLKRLNPAIVSMQPSGIRRIAEAARAVEGCISLTLGEPGFETPSPIREAAKRALDLGETHYPPNAGIPALREAIAAAEQAKYGTPLTAGNVLITCGSTEAIACAILAIIQPGDEVIVPTPAFGLYAQQLTIARGVYVPLHTAPHGFQLDADALERLITPRTKAILLNSPNNPTGVQYTQASIDAATALCLKHNLFLIFDAVYDRLSYLDTVPMPSFAALGERLILCNAFSKPYAMTGWRIGYCIAQEAILRELTKVHAALTVGVSTFSQVGCIDIFSVPTDAMREAYRENRDLVCARLTEMGMDVIRPDGAFYAFPSIARYGMDDEAFVMRLLHEQRVAVVPGDCFGTPGYIRLSYCTDRDTLAEGLSRLAQFLHTLNAR